MSNTEPTEPLPSEPGRTPPGTPPREGSYGTRPDPGPDGTRPYGTAPYGTPVYGTPPYGTPPYGTAYGTGAYRAVPGEPFYRRHGLAFAIATLVLSIIVVLGIVTAGAFAVASVVAHVGERTISHVIPPGQGSPLVPGQPGKGNGNGSGKGGGGGAQSGGGTQQGRVLLRGTIASISGDTWSIDRQNGGSAQVTVTSSTIFGTPGQSASKSDFAKGDEVIVIGKGTDGSVTATRILKLAAFPTRPPSTPGTPSTPGS